MNKIKLIHGPAKSGKTKFAIELANNVPSFVYIFGKSLTNRNERYWLSGLPEIESTKLIIVDDVPAISLNRVFGYLSQDTMVIEHKGEMAQEITRPDVVIITESIDRVIINDESIMQRIEILDAKQGLINKDFIQIVSCKPQVL